MDAGEHGRAPGVGPVDGVVQLHDGHHPPERLREDALAVGVAAPGRGQPEVLADEERLRAAGDRRRHWPQVDAAGAGARRPGRRGRHREQQEQPRPQRRRHLCRVAPGSGSGSGRPQTTVSVGSRQSAVGTVLSGARLSDM